MQRLFVAPLTLFVPSGTAQADVGKLTLVGSAVTLFFLFTGAYFFPGGARHFPMYADALAHGTTLEPSLAQRDIGFPLVILLSGYTFTGSFVGVTLIQAAFAILIPMFIYMPVAEFSRPAGFYASIFAILTLSPVYFMKMIHHDQTYIFFMMLMIAFLLTYLQRRDVRFLYYFTAAAVGASLTRPAGNLLFPIFLAIAYLSARGKIVPYLGCAVAVIGATGLYQWNRYEMFDMRAQASIPSYTGQQIYYGLYINSAEFGVRLNSALGPNMKRITDALRQAVQPTPKDSLLVKSSYGEGAALAFAREYIYPFSADEFMRQVFTVPSNEYYIMMTQAEPNDQVFLKASWEIFARNPGYVFLYTIRNMSIFLFRPGYAHTRYNVNPFSREGIYFPPDYGRDIGLGDTGSVRPRAVREVSFDPLPLEPSFVQWLYRKIRGFWLAHYINIVAITSILMFVAWAAVLAAFVKEWLRLPIPAILGGTVAGRGFVASIVAASALLFYNALVTAAFAEPEYRYHHFVLPLRILISGYGAIILVRLIVAPLERRRWFPPPFCSRYARLAAASLRNNDVVDQLVSSNPRLFTVILAVLVLGGFQCWAWSLANLLR